ncbi:50S ribosomal protein HLP, mitochondrial-like protein [Tanacetum coccineum]
MPGCSWRGHLRGVHIHYCPGVLGGDTCEGYIFITARVFLEGTPVMGTYGFHYCPGVLGGDTYDGYIVHRFHELRGLESVRYGVSKVLDTTYWGFLGVGTTFDIFQNIHLLYLQYRVLVFSGYDVGNGTCEVAQGAKRVMCIQALKGKKGARLGDTIVASMKEVKPGRKVKKGQVVYGVAVRAAMQKGRCDGSEVKLDDNAVVLVNKQGKHGNVIFTAWK